ncbi:unnamed protein product, partial [Leptidea sinapis]
ITSEDIRETRDCYGLNDVKRINESLDFIQEWAQKQEHLKESLQYINRGILERLLLLSRGSVEATKSKLDKFLTYRNMMPELCLNRNADEFQIFSKWGAFLPLPKKCAIDHTRVLVTQLLPPEQQDDFNLLTYFRYAFLLGEIKLHYDYWDSERYIVDLTHMNLGYLTKLINPIVIKKAELLCTEAFGTKIKGIHLINAPNFVDKFVLILKQALKPKVAGRIYIHDSYEDLQKHIPKEILPEDFGGNGPRIAKLADESKRSSSKFNEEYLGMPGSFRKLDVD